MRLVTRNISASCSGNTQYVCMCAACVILSFTKNCCTGLKENSPLSAAEELQQMQRNNFSPEIPCVVMMCDWMDVSSCCYCSSHKAKESVNRAVISNDGVTDGQFRPASGCDRRRDRRQRKGKTDDWFLFCSI